MQALATKPHDSGPATGRPVIFEFSFPHATSVYLVGDFNSWNPVATPLVPNGDLWVTTLDLRPGDYEYKFVVDGKWIAGGKKDRSYGGRSHEVINPNSCSLNRRIQVR